MTRYLLALSSGLCLGALAFAFAVTGVAHASSIHATVKGPADTTCTLAYPTFEASVPHIDLENCPGGETSDKVFCRAKTGYDEIIVYKFSAEGGRCLISTKTYDMDHFKLTIFDFVTKSD